MGDVIFTGHGANVVGSLGSGSMIQDMPSTFGGDSTSAIISGANVADLNSQSAYTIMAWAYQDAEASQSSYSTVAIAGDNFHFVYNDSGYLHQTLNRHQNNLLL